MNNLRPACLATRLAALPAIALLLMSGAYAQGSAVAPEPPRLEKLEEGEAPAVTIPAKPSEQQIVEQRDHGQVKQVRVTSGGSTYYVKPNQPKGSALPGDLQSTANQPAQWQVLEFYTRRKDEQDQPGSAANPAVPAAPAPAR